MGFFSGKFTHRLDRKGRVSIPARWRPLLNGGAGPGVFAAAVPEAGCIECYPEETMAERRDVLHGKRDFPDPQHRMLAFAMFSDYPLLPLDSDGRIVIPGDLLERTGFVAPAAGIPSRRSEVVHTEAVLAGGGDRFFIFRPDAIEAFTKAARKLHGNAGSRGA